MNPAEKYILEQQEPFKSILFQLQILIEKEIPELELKYRWRIPYYYLAGNPFCFLHVSKGYVDVGFRVGPHLEAYFPYMVSEKRKVMKSLRYYSVEDIDHTLLIDVISLLKQHYKNRK